MRWGEQWIVSNDGFQDENKLTTFIEVVIVYCHYPDLSSNMHLHSKATTLSSNAQLQNRKKKNAQIRSAKVQIYGWRFKKNFADVSWSSTFIRKKLISIMIQVHQNFFPWYWYVHLASTRYYSFTDSALKLLISGLSTTHFKIKGRQVWLFKDN